MRNESNREFKDSLFTSYFSDPQRLIEAKRGNPDLKTFCGLPHRAGQAPPLRTLAMTGKDKTWIAALRSQ